MITFFTFLSRDFVLSSWLRIGLGSRLIDGRAVCLGKDFDRCIAVNIHHIVFYYKYSTFRICYCTDLVYKNDCLYTSESDVSVLMFNPYSAGLVNRILCL